MSPERLARAELGDSSSDALRISYDPFESFLSDNRINRTKYRDVLVKWLRLWDFPLEAEEPRAGPRERSIIQTNWLRDVSPNLKDRAVARDCIREADSFLGFCERRRPGLILLFGGGPREALTSRELRPRVEEVFGSLTGKRPVEDIAMRVFGKRYFRIRRIRFERATVLALPHATGSRGVSDEFLSAHGEAKAELARWWVEHQEHLKRQGGK